QLQLNVFGNVWLAIGNYRCKLFGFGEKLIRKSEYTHQQWRNLPLCIVKNKKYFSGIHKRGVITRHGDKLIIENLLTGIKKLIIKYSNCLKYNKQSYRPDHKCAQYKNNSMHRIGTLSVYLGFAIQLIHYQGDLRYRNGR